MRKGIEIHLHAREVGATSMRMREVLFQVGLILGAIVIGHWFESPFGYAVAALLCIALVFQWIVAEEELAEGLESRGLFGGSIPWSELKVPARPPNLKMEETQYPPVRLDSKTGTWREDWGTDNLRAFVISVRNDPYEDNNGTDALEVRAQIWWEYSTGVPGPNLSPAPWIDEECGTIDIPVGYTKKLIVGIKGGDRIWCGWTNPKSKPGGFSCAKQHNMLPDRGTMHIRIIGKTGEVWFSANTGWEWDDPRNPHIRPLT